MENRRFKLVIKKILKLFGIDVKKLVKNINRWSIHFAFIENGFKGLIEKLREIAPDISHQEESEKELFDDYSELKRRTLQAFQSSLMLKALESHTLGRLTVVDVGDSAGTHLLYLKELTKGRFDIDGIGVNLDPRAIRKIEARGLKAILSRAEELDLGKMQVDLFTSFEMVEHLHNPTIFFRRLAKKSSCNNLVITVPYLKKSRVGFHHIRNKTDRKIFAEDEHIFELSPEDWTLHILHSGWKVIYSKIYYQYPRRWPIISSLLSLYWRVTDFEGFWGAILERDTAFSDYYQDWEC